MDISYTSEFDAKRYEAYIRRALGLKALRVSYFSWCMAIFGGLSLYDHWVRHYDLGFFDCVFTVLAVYPLLMLFLRWIHAHQYMKTLRRMMCGEVTSHCRLTDEWYEVSCGAMSQKLPWKSLAVEYKFFDDDTLALLQVKGQPSIVLLDLTKHGVARKDLESVLIQAGVRGHRVSVLCKIWTIMSGVMVSLLALFSVFAALVLLVMPCGHGQLIFRNDCEVPVVKAGVSFGRNKFELGSVAPQEEKAESFFVGGDSTCRVVATLADGLVVSNSYGYYCYGMDCGVIRVTVTKDRRIKIVDKYCKYDRNEDGRNGEDGPTAIWMTTRLP